MTREPTNLLTKGKQLEVYGNTRHSRHSRHHPRSAPSSESLGATTLEPQNLQAEEAILGALLSAGAIGGSEGDRVQAAVAALDPSDFFYVERHGLLFAAIRRLHRDGAPFDPISVADELDRSGDLHRVGGRTRLWELAQLYVAFANVKHWAAIVRRLALERRDCRLLQLLDSAREHLVTEGADERIRDLLVRALEAFEEQPR